MPRRTCRSTCRPYLLASHFKLLTGALGLLRPHPPSDRFELAVKLVAELSSAFLSADLSLTPEVRDDYIASWLKVLRNDKRAIFTAAAHARRAVDFLHGM